jgi:hypothetical protein
MRDQRGTGHLTAAVDEVHDPFGQHAFNDLEQTGNGKRRQFRRLDHACVSECQSAGDLHGRQPQRHVPGTDQRAHSDWLISDEAHQSRLLREHLAAGLVDILGKEAEIVGRARNVHVARLGKRNARVDGLEHGEFVGMGEDCVMDPGQGCLALSDRGCSPWSLVKGGSCGIDRCIDLVRRGLEQCRDPVFRCRIDDGDLLCAGGAGKPARYVAAQQFRFTVQFFAKTGHWVPLKTIISACETRRAAWVWWRVCGRTRLLPPIRCCGRSGPQGYPGAASWSARHRHAGP